MTPEVILMLVLLGAVAVALSAFGSPARKSSWKWRNKWKWKKKKPETKHAETIAGDEVADYEIAEFRKHTKSKKYLMTFTENMFFRGLLPAAEVRGLLVFTKVRLVDLVDIDEDYGRFEQIFRKLVAKHIDFVLADNMGRPTVCIELDDYRHEAKNRNDTIKDELMRACRIAFIRVKVAKEYDYDDILGPVIAPTEYADPVPVIADVVNVPLVTKTNDDWKTAGERFRPSWQK